jgi:hypothetical protein
LSPTTEIEPIAHSGPDTTHYGSRYDLRESEPAAGREASMKHVTRHTKFPDRSRLAARPHGSTPSPALSSGEASGWPLARNLNQFKCGKNPANPTPRAAPAVGYPSVWLFVGAARSTQKAKSRWRWGPQHKGIPAAPLLALPRRKVTHCADRLLQALRTSW